MRLYGRPVQAVELVQSHRGIEGETTVPPALSKGPRAEILHGVNSRVCESGIENLRHVLGIPDVCKLGGSAMAGKWARSDARQDGRT